jgi:hypothetical protein
MVLANPRVGTWNLEVPVNIRSTYSTRFLPSLPDGMAFGKYCTHFGNPGSEGFGDLSRGFWSFDNILLSWIVIFQHVGDLRVFLK